MRHISETDIADIAHGAAVLGSGGGGDPWIGSLLAQAAIAQHGPVELVDPDDLTDESFVLPVAMMGAPTVIVEKPPAGDEFLRAFAAVERSVGRTVTHVACLEAGGLNSMTPIVTAAQTGLPLIDGDGMGRAFPELQMVVFTLDGIPATPMAMADEKGNTLLLNTIDNDWAELLARSATVDMGCSASIALYPLTGAEARAGLVPGTLSLAQEVGELLASAKFSPADALAAKLHGRALLHGKVLDVERRTVAGFARGQASLAGLDEDDGLELTVQFQNEHLLASRSDGLVVSTPDLICVLDHDTGRPITTEAMRYGFRVDVVGLPCHPRWRTPAGIALVGPRYFGYDQDYEPLERDAG
jgi:uncharacterized protein